MLKANKPESCMLVMLTILFSILIIVIGVSGSYQNYEMNITERYKAFSPRIDDAIVHELVNILQHRDDSFERMWKYNNNDIDGKTLAKIHQQMTEENIALYNFIIRIHEGNLTEGQNEIPIANTYEEIDQEIKRIKNVLNDRK